MIVPDLNLLVYAFNASARDHVAAVRWWEGLLSSPTLVGIPWIVLLGFLRLMTGRHVVMEPYKPQEAVAIVEEWLERPNVRHLPATTTTHRILAALIRDTQAAGALITDAAIAAAAIEHGAVVHSNDTDFARFPSLQVHNPLVEG